MGINEEGRRFRQHHADERRLPWLRLLLDALAVIDAGVDKALQRDQQAGRRLACYKGCHHCCVSHLIPVTPLEVAGMAWFAKTQLSGDDARALQLSLEQWMPSGEAGSIAKCPFNVQGVCIVYPLRPIACRQFHVYSKPCAAGEDVFTTRPGDVMRPIREYKLAADRLMLAHYGFQSPEAVEQAMAQDYLKQISSALMACDWSVISAKSGKGRQGEG